MKTFGRPMSFGHALKLARPLVVGGSPPRPPTLLGTKEAARLEAGLPYRSVIPMAQRLVEGDVCYALRDGSGEVQSFVWAASGRDLYLYELDLRVPIPADVVYLYDAYTPHARRGRGLMGGLLRGAAFSLARQFPGARWCEIWTDARNGEALRSFRRAGFRVYGSYRWLAVGPARLARGNTGLDGYAA